MKLDMQTIFICAPEPVLSGQAFHFDLDAYSGILVDPFDFRQILSATIVTYIF